jgi:DNA repair exonuclease SbcCD ATPase subunit
MRSPHMGKTMTRVAATVLMGGWLLGTLATPLAADWKFWKKEGGGESGMSSREVRQALKDAEEYREDGQLGKALELYQQVVTEAPEDAEGVGDALYGVAIISLTPYRSVRDLERAQRALLQLTDSYPDHPRRLEVAVALSWIEQLQRNQARSDQLQAQIDKERAELRKEREALAEEAEKASGEKADRSSEVRTLRAELQRSQEELEKARAELEKKDAELARKEEALQKVQQALVGKQGS